MSTNNMVVIDIILQVTLFEILVKETTVFKIV